MAVKMLLNFLSAAFAVSSAEERSSKRLIEHPYLAQSEALRLNLRGLLGTFAGSCQPLMTSLLCWRQGSLAEACFSTLCEMLREFHQVS